MRKRSVDLITIIFLAALCITGCGTIDNNIQPAGNSLAGFPEVESRHIDIFSDGTRLSGDLFYPKGSKAGDKLPAIIFCHGWGGKRAHLNAAYAPIFAEAGYVVLTFDYRGWADSDSRLVINGDMPKPDKNGEITVKARAIRELVDPFDQTEDIKSTIDFISGEPMVDPKRIGLWGTSFGGGHVVYVAALDRRVKCIVSQVPSMSGGWVHQYFQPERMAIQQARGEIDPVPQGSNKISGLEGTPHLYRIANYYPVSVSNKIRIPVLIVVASKEELIDNQENGQKVFNIIKNNVPSKYKIFNGTHFEIYSKGREWAIELAIKWYDKYL